jgi:hypothetical protein
MATAPTQVTQYQTGIAPELAPYMQNLLGQQAARMYTYEKDAQGNPVLDEAGMPKITGFQPFQAYGTDRVAGLTGLQTGAFEAAKNLGYDPTTKAAATGIEGLAQRAGQLSYAPSQAVNRFQTPGAYQTGQFNAQQVSAPGLQQYQMGPFERVSGQNLMSPEMQAAQSGYQPNLQQYQMGPAQQVRTQSFARPGTAEAYMSPYMQNVVDIQQREARRASQIGAQQQAAEAVGRGAFGGSRDAIMRAERERNLATQLGDIQATGQQAAYSQAQQQFNQEQQARLAAQQANQQAGLTVGGQNLSALLGVQGLGAQYGTQMALANLSNQQQAAVQNQAAQLQTQGLSAQQAMQAALANQQAGLTTGQQNLQALLGIQQLGAGQNLQAQLANQQQGMTAQQLAEQSRQFGAGQGMTAAQLAAQYGLSADQLAEQSRQYGAGLGLQGLQTGLSGYGQLAGVGQNLYGQNVGNITLQSQLGTQQQQQNQNIETAKYQDWLSKQNYPQQQMDVMASYIRGTPLSTTGATQYQAAPSTLSQVVGLGTAGAGAYGMYNAMNKPPGSKKGGAIKEKKPGGLEALALSKLG